MHILLFGPAVALRAALEARGHGVHAVDGADAAWEVVEAVRPPLVVLAEPNDEALTLCRRLRDGTRQDLLIVVPAPPMPLLSELIEAGVDAYLFEIDSPERLDAQLDLLERRLHKRSRQERVEADLHQQTAQARGLLDSMTDAFMTVDAEWRFTFVNREAEKLLRRRRGDLLGAGLWSAFSETAGSVFHEQYQRALDENRPVSFEAYYSPLETWFKVNAYPYEGGLAIYFTDVTEHRQVGEALRESEAKAHAILETTVDGIVTIDPYGHIESFNQAAERIFGYTEAEVLGKNVQILMPEPYREEHDGYLSSYRETGRRKIIGIGREVRGRRKDGSTFPMDLAVSEVHLGGRRIFTGIVRDITERWRLEQEVLGVSEQERQRIGQDLHDGLGQMLTGIGLISKNLARRLQEEGHAAAADAAEVTAFIREADEQARGLARGLVPVDLEASGLVEALRRLTANAEQLFGIEGSFESVGPALLHDNIVATHLYRIAQEAISNAVLHGHASHVSITLAAGPQRLRLRIIDDGVGFPEEAQIRHESDFRGMGVRIMHHRAYIIGASLEVRNGLDRGAVVTCTLRLTT